MDWIWKAFIISIIFGLAGIILFFVNTIIWDIIATILLIIGFGIIGISIFLKFKEADSTQKQTQ